MEKTESVSRCQLKRLNTPLTSGDEGESPTPQNTFSPAIATDEKAESREGDSAFSVLSGVEGKNPHAPKSVAPVPRYLDYTANLTDSATDGGYIGNPQTPLPPEIHLQKSRVKQCTPKYIVKQCSCGRHIVPSACMSLACTRCAPHTGRRRAMSIFNRLIPPEFTRTPAVVYIVLTVPPALRSEYLESYRWQKVRKQAWKILQKMGAVYGVEVSHPIGDAGNGFHPHLNFLIRMEKGVKPYMDVIMLRQAWGDILGVSSADVHVQYSYSRGKIYHWCKYVSRVFPGYHHWTGPVRWYGRYTYTRIMRMRESCAMCGEEYKVIGAIRAEDVDSWYKIGWQLGLAPPWERENLIKRFKPQKNKVKSE